MLVFQESHWLSYNNVIDRSSTQQHEIIWTEDFHAGESEHNSGSQPFQSWWKIKFNFGIHVRPRDPSVSFFSAALYASIGEDLGVDQSEGRTWLKLTGDIAFWAVLRQTEGCQRAKPWWVLSRHLKVAFGKYISPYRSPPCCLLGHISMGETIKMSSPLPSDPSPSYLEPLSESANLHTP